MNVYIIESKTYKCQATKSAKLNDLEMIALAINLVRDRFSRLYSSNVILDLLLDVWTASREARSAKNSWASLPQAP